MDELKEALIEYNALLRSSYQVAERLGENTNWPAFANELRRCLDKHHSTWMKLCLEDLHEPTA